MPVVTPFGDLTLGDSVALSRWAQAHAAKHQGYAAENIYAAQFLKNGASNQPGQPAKPGSYVVVGNTGGNLDEPVDGDWMLRHGLKHVSLATTAPKSPASRVPPLSSSDTKLLILPDIWQTEEQLQDWHALHNRLHKLIDAQRAISSVQAKPNQPHLPGRPGGISPAPPHGPIP